MIEYHVLVGDPGVAPTVEAWLNEQAAVGWELVTFIRRHDERQADLWIFKREAQP